MLDSALGCYDGRVYERMYDWARRAPSNKEQVSFKGELRLKERIDGVIEWQ